MIGKITRRIIFLTCAFLIVLMAIGFLMRIYGPMAESHQRYGEITKV